MSIEELNQKISVIISSDSTGNYKRDACKKLSVEYTISVLEEVLSNNTYTFGNQDIYDSIEVKIEELKQYLNE